MSGRIIRLSILAVAMAGWWTIIGCQKAPEPPTKAERAINGLMPAGTPGTERHYVEDQTSAGLGPARKVSYEPLKVFREANQRRAAEPRADSTESTTQAEVDAPTTGEEQKATVKVKPSRRKPGKKSPLTGFVRSLADTALKARGPGPAGKPSNDEKKKQAQDRPAKEPPGPEEEEEGEEEQATEEDDEGAKQAPSGGG